MLKRFKTRLIGSIAHPDSPPSAESQNSAPGVPLPAALDESIRELWDVCSQFVNRFRSQIDKGVAELMGISSTFDNIRWQMINNRLNTIEREDRIAQKIVAPLQAIATTLRGTIKENAAELQSRIIASRNESAPIQKSSEWEDIPSPLLVEMDRGLSELDQVIAILPQYETQNELLDIVRRLITNQEELSKATEAKRKRDAFQGLLDE